MRYSRLRRHNRKQQERRLKFIIAGIVIFLLLLYFFGVQMLIGLSYVFERFQGRGTEEVAPATQSILLPPRLDPLEEATNTSQLTITGSGDAGQTLILYRNDDEIDRTTIDEDGTFEIDIPALEGDNFVSAKVILSDGTLSDLSNVEYTQVIIEDPDLVIDTPSDGDTLSGDDDTVEVTGVTGEEMRITINDRIVVVEADGSFTYAYPLEEGENTLTIIATDKAGNTSERTRTVTYEN